MAVISMTELKNELSQNKIRSCYLFTGEEEYLRRQYTEILKKTVLPSDDDMNYTKMEGKNCLLEDLDETAGTMPFFAERRMITVDGSGWFRTGTDTDLSSFIKNLPDTACVLFVEAEIDKRSRNYKAMQKDGTIVSFDTPDERMLISWIGGFFRKEGKKISADTAVYLIRRCGTNMDTLRNEMEKLASYAMNEDAVTADHINELCSRHLEDQIFAMMDAVAGGKQKETLAMYNELLALRESPMKILALLSRHFRILLQIKDMESLGMSGADMAQAAGVPPFAVKKYRAQAASFSAEELRKAADDCLESDELIKSGNMSDILTVETFLVRYTAGRKN